MTEYYISDTETATNANVKPISMHKVIIEEDEDGYLIGKIPDLNIVTQGENEAILWHNLYECIRLVKETTWENDGKLE